MTPLPLPCTIFKTQNRMDDYSANDMRYGDLTEEQLKRHYHLIDVSSRVDAYTMAKLSPFAQPQSRFHGARKPGEKISRDTCAAILFDEMRSLSHTFSLYGPYSLLMGQMIDHMQYGDGRPFSRLLLNTALREQITGDKTEKSTMKLIKIVIERNINWSTQSYPSSKKNELIEAIYLGKLPKFDRIKDSFNGMGITVHDTWATHIYLKSININQNSYQATLNYKVQDHFGLDTKYISKIKFSQFKIFRIWFLLQRYKEFGFKPFMTNLDAIVKIEGKRNEIIQ